MMLALVIGCLGALVFEPQALPVELSPPDSLTGQVSANFRLGDLDGNGEPDLLFPDRVFFQEGGHFQTDRPVPLYSAGDRACLDIRGDRLYFRTLDRLAVVCWREGAWHELRKQSMRWPAPGSEDGDGTVFDRFVHDLDRDGEPEIVLPDDDGLHIFRWNGKEYEESGSPVLFPPLRVASAPARELWPPQARRIAFPMREMTCRYLIEENRAIIVFREGMGDRLCRYHVVRYLLDPQRRLQPDSGPPDEWITEPMPNEMQPCRLGPDDQPAFAGGDWELSEASALPVPVFETRVTFDRGKTWQSFRSVSFRPQCLFVDADGDGCSDLVTETIGLLEGGIRESVNRFLGARRVEHEVAIRLQRNRAFASRPDWRARFAIELDAPPVRNSEFFARYQAGELIDLTGDFDGDGRRDLLVQDRPGRLAVYPSGASGFAAEAVAFIAVESNARFAVNDVNGDGRSDIAVFPAQLDRGDGLTAQVWFSRKGAR
ncbi:MAG TPA: VCBS repeat-containing protein [Candidatus Hydrogenedentes bacterium]|nr:VCBS repeat-containing protein [Candidatus Hydrogenedentota bacterium]